jgi:PII-like signaling protein
MAGESQEMEIRRAEEAVLLRIYVGDGAKFGHLPLYEAIVLKAREMHLAGATVLRSSMGFGAASRLHTAKILQLSTDLPIVIEIVDFQEKIEPFLKVLDGMMDGGLVTLCPVQVHHYKPRVSK